MTSSEQKLEELRSNLVAWLRDNRDKGGGWQGELSSSALSTAVAVFALAQFDKEAHSAEISRGLHWLAQNSGSDGGWGDTTDSPSNISTTLLAWSALSLSDGSEALEKANRRAEKWITDRVGSLEPDAIAAEVLRFYGDDRTFSAPIVMFCTLAGRMGQGRGPWKRVPQLPFELSVFPRSLFRFLKLDVVSYAVPALIAVGYVRFFHKRSWWNPLSWLRSLVKGRAFKRLESIQPANGGFLEAAPLTGFVLMSMCRSGLKDHKVAKKCASFLKESIRPDGSFPIDTNLSTWVSTLAINALTENGRDHWLDEREQKQLLDFLMKQQHKAIHPFTGAAPGGWAWTPLPGAVPDADDTSGALLSLRRLGEGPQVAAAAGRGIGWLLDLQNSDGGIPTFCRGWGKLPFDQSCPDITAHALRAFLEWKDTLSGPLLQRVNASIERMISYLKKTQRSDGSWIPLWFGNQHTAKQENPVYGTGQVVVALYSLKDCERADIKALAEKGASWLASVQNSDGSWGGDKDTPGSLEETGLAVNALSLSGTAEDQVSRGLEALHRLSEGGQKLPAAPIGLYFASLWYREKMYPAVYALAAVERVSSQG